MIDMKVRHNIAGNIYTVYDIQYDSNGYPHFLIYMNHQWIRISAKHYSPAEEGGNG